MPLRIEDRLGQYTTTEGTGAYTTAGAITAFRTLDSKLAVNDYFYGYVEAVDANGDPTGEWECGLYTKTGANTFARTAIHSSSNGDAAVNWGSGTKRMTLALTAYMLKYIDTAAKAGSSPPPEVQEPAPGQPRPALDNTSAYGSLTFRDEFDGSTINSAKWPMQRLWYEAARYANRGNIDVSNGKMRIWASPWSTSQDPTLRYPNEGGDYKNHNATICTDGVFWQKYGFFEARIKMPKGKGPFPAFWLYGHADVNGAEVSARPEIDIVECYPSGTVDKAWSTSDNRPINHVCTVWLGDGSQSGYRKGNDVGIWNIDLSADFHIYGCHWDSTGVQFYFDRQPFGSKIPTTIQHPLYILLDYWMGGESGSANDPYGTLDETPANSMEIDYVRAWRLADGSTIVRGTAVESEQQSPVVELTEPIDWYGNSVIYGWDPTLSGGANEGDPVNITMPEAFNAFAPTSSGVNRAINGLTATNILEGTGGVAWASWAAHMAATTTKYIMLYARETDSTVNLQTKLTSLVQQAKAAGKTVFVLTEVPSQNAGTLTHDQIAATQRTVAYDNGVHVIDLNAFMSDYMVSNGLTIANVCPDTQHPAQQYYTLMGQWAKSKFVELLAKSTVSVRGVTAGGSSVLTATHDTAVFTPEAGKMYLLAVNALQGAIAASHPTPTVTGNGMTWELVTSQDIDAGTGGYYGKMSLFKAMAAASAGTVSPPADDPAQTGTTYYVATTGNDTTGTGSSGAPFATLAKAVTLVNPGDTVIVKDGEYTMGSLSINRSGTALNRILIKAENKWGAKILSTSTCSPAIQIFASYITLKDLHIDLAPGNTGCPGDFSSANCHIRAWNSTDPSIASPSTGRVGFIADGIKTSGGLYRDTGIKSNQDDSIIRNCDADSDLEMLNVKNGKIYGNVCRAQNTYGCSILVKGGVRDCLIFNNVIYNTHATGQPLIIGGYSCDECHFDPSTNVEAYNCYAYNNVVVNQTGQPMAGLMLQGSRNCGFFNNVVVGGTLAMTWGGHNTGPQARNTNPIWKNNICVGSGASYISTRGWVYDGTLTLDYNLFHNYSSVPSQAHPASGDPLFVNEESDWNLRTDSPARNKGQVIAALPLYHGGTVDIGKDFGFVVRSGSAWDLGVYEYGSVASGSVRMVFDKGQYSVSWSLVEVSNMDSNTPIVQNVKGRADSVTSLELTYAAFAKPTNASLAFFGGVEEAGVTKTFTPSGGMTEIHDVSFKYSGIQSEYKYGATTKVASTANTTVNMAGIAVEVSSKN